MARRFRPWKAVGIVALVVGGAYVFYLAAVNVLLRTRIVRDVIAAATDEILLEYENGYSWIPGRIHVDGLVLRGRDGNVEWILRVDHCDFWTTFVELADQKFHANSVRIDGMSLRLRRRRDSFTSSELAALPPIPGFLDPPLTDLGPPAPPRSEKDYNLWSVRIEDVVAKNIREIWVDSLRYTGRIDLRGRWAFRPLRWVDIGPAQLGLRSVAVSHGSGPPYVLGVDGSLGIAIAPFDPRVTAGAALPGRLSVDGEVRGGLRLARLLDVVVKDRTTRFTASDTHFWARFDVDRGVVRPRTHGHLHCGAARAERNELGLRGALTADVSLDGSLIDGRPLAVTGRLSLRDAHAAVASLDAFVPQVEVVAERVEIAQGRRGGRLTVDVPDVEVDSLAQVNSILHLPDSVHVERGAAQGSAKVDLDLTTISGPADLRLVARDLALQVGRDSMAGELTATLTANQLGPFTELSGSSVAFRSAPLPRTIDWWGLVELQDAHLGAAGAPQFRARIVGRAKDASPIQSIVARGTPVPRWVLGLVSTRRLEFDGDLRAGPSMLLARSVRAQSAGARAAFEFAELGAEKGWALLLQTGPLSVGIGRENGKTGCRLFGARGWFEQRVAHLHQLERASESGGDP